ncbi:MAG: SdrD B-like domain-containing protein [Litorimonas sp.]
MRNILQTNARNLQVSYKKVILSTACVLPIAIITATPAHAQLVNTATVTGTPAAGNLANTTATESVTLITPITAEPESFPVINGANGGVTSSVLASDTLNGVAVDPADVTLTVGASDPELSLDPVTGLITVAPGTPAGTYTVEYTICEDLNPTNCATVTETVTVGEAPITAAPDTVTGIDSNEGASNVINVLSDDTLNGVPATPQTVTVTVAPGASLPNGITLNPDGSVDVAPGTPAGTYTVEYQICEILNPTNCTTSTVTVVVEPGAASLSGIVFLDSNGDDERSSDETLLAGWIVEILDADGNVVATTVTDENGFYEAEDLVGGEYTVRFRNPDTNAVFGVIEDVVLTPGQTATEQNLPIDPSGVVYDAVTREPVEGAVLTLTDANGTPLPPICFIDPSQQNQTTDEMGMYRFDLVPGADPACPFGQTNFLISFDAPESHLDTNSTIIGAEPGFLSPPAGSGPFEVSPDATAPQNGDATTYYLGFTLGQGSRDVINNHIPLDPINFTRSPLTVTKVTPQRDVNIGDLVPYTITVTNTEDLPRIDLDIIDFAPPGFSFVDGTVRLNGLPVEPELDGRNLIINDVDFAANETQTLSLIMVVGAGVSEGTFTNQAFIRDTLGAEISGRAEARVRVSPDSLFDCSEIIGKVFDDKDKDGYQTKGEPGLAGVRLATATGLIVTTDQYGRYHITCAAVPNENIGSNFILKVDEKSLPTGYHPTSENPRVIRLTRGKVSKANFAAALENVLTLELNDAAFVGTSATLKSEYAGQLGLLIEALKGQESTLRLNYFTQFEGQDERLSELASQIKDMWKTYGDDYDLNIERKTIIANRGRATSTGKEG